MTIEREPLVEKTLRRWMNSFMLRSVFGSSELADPEWSAGTNIELRACAAWKLGGVDVAILGDVADPIAERLTTLEASLYASPEHMKGRALPREPRPCPSILSWRCLCAAHS
jgi:hypothetical protein